MIQSGVLAASVFCKQMLAVKRCSSIRLPCRKPCCSSGCIASSESSMRPNMRYANNLYSKRTFAIGRKSDTDFAVLVFGSILKSVICQEGGTIPLVSTWVITCSKAFKKSSGECFKSSATRPKKSPVLPTFKRDIACFNSAIVQGASVNLGLVMGGAGSPWNKRANISAKSSARGWICNFIARRPNHDPQHFPRWRIAQVCRKFSRSPQAKFLPMELSDMERQFLPPHGINGLAPVVAEVPERWGWFECDNLCTRNTILFSTFKNTVFQYFARKIWRFLQHFPQTILKQTCGSINIQNWRPIFQIQSLVP